MSDDIGSSKGFNRKFLKKKYEYKKKARRNQNNNQTKYQEEDDDLDEEDNKDEKVKNKKSININTKLNSKFYSGDSEDSEKDDNEEEYQGILSKKSNNTPKSSILKNNRDSSNLGFTCGINSPFSPTGSLNSDFGFSDNNFDFVNPESEFTEQMNTEIHIHKVIRRNKANKFDTIVRGLHSLGKERVKKILSKIMGDLGIGGCIKNLKELDPEPVLYFSGNYADKIKNILMVELDKSEDFFHTHC